MIAKTAASGGPSLHPTILAFTSSLSQDRALAREDLIGSLAHVRMLAATKLVPADVAATLHGGLVTLLEEARAGKLVVPDEEDIHMAIEARLDALVGAAAAGRLHTARSRNDQVSLALRLHVREACRTIVDALGELVEAMVLRAEADRAIVLPAYTHRQRAQPVSLAYFWLGHASALARDLDAFRTAYRQADAMPLGVGAIAGTSLPIDRELVREVLGFERLTTNGLDTVGDRDFALDFAYAAARMLVHTSRLATDIVDFASSEFGFVRLGDDVSFGSSMMPQKRNPDVFELVRGKAGGAIGDLVALLTTIKGLPGGYNRDLQDDRAPILAAGPRVLGVVSALMVTLPRLTFDAARCAAAVAESASQATDLAEALVKKGLAFRTAYQAVGALVHACAESKTRLDDVTLEQAQRVDASFDAEVLLAAKVSGSIARKVSAGGTGEASIGEQLVTLRGLAVEARSAAAAMPSLDALARRVADSGGAGEGGRR